MTKMIMGKGTSKFSTLTARDLYPVQETHLKERFELAEKSILAQKAVQCVNSALDHYESKEGTTRVKPGQMIAEHRGQKVILPILEQNLIGRLGVDMNLAEVKRHHEYEQYLSLLETNPELTFGELWQCLGTGDHNRKRAPKDFDFLPEELFKCTTNLRARNPEDLSQVPTAVMKEALAVLTEYGSKKGQAEAMTKVIAGIRAWCCPLINELEPGQMVWLAYSTKSKRRGSPRLLVPVVLTLVSLEEQRQEIKHIGDYRALKLGQLTRITTEAWHQDGVLTSSDLEWLLNASSTMVRSLLEAYQEHFGVILPTAGTVLDMGRSLTHKKIIVEMSLDGMTTQEIANQVYHSPVSVDAYLKTFDKLLVLRYYKMPQSAIMRVLGHGRKLIEEHLALAEKHFPTEEALVAYLEGRGVTLEKIC